MCSSIYGRFVIGGPAADTGLTGRKIIVDTYGGYSRHGGGSFSGKDPTKVDRSAAYMARYIAKNLVAAGAAKNWRSNFLIPSEFLNQFLFLSKLLKQRKSAMKSSVKQLINSLN